MFAKLILTAFVVVGIFAENSSAIKRQNYEQGFHVFRIFKCKKKNYSINKIGQNLKTRLYPDNTTKIQIINVKTYGKLNNEVSRKKNYKKLHKFGAYNKSTFESFGAVGDGVNDDTKAISRALNSTSSVLYSSKKNSYYRVSNLIVIVNSNNKKIIFTDSKLLNSSVDKATFLFKKSNNLEIIGGKFGYVNMPTKNGGNSQHVFQFDSCQNINLKKVHILNSPEMGIAITNCNKVTIESSSIEHTFRDGTYSHYSSNVTYLDNIYNNIKDDAMSFHDYGIDSQKAKLLTYGYKQATNFAARGNKVKNAYQGISSIGATNVNISGNYFENTVLAGIAVFNSEELYPMGTALVNHITINNNTIKKACSDVLINGKIYINNGQASTGRAALFVGSLGKNNQLNNGEVKMLSKVIIKNNIINNSKAHGLFCYMIDDLQLIENTLFNCSGSVPSKSLSGDVIELTNIDNFFGDKNTIIDNRSTPLHQHGYSINNVLGRMGRWKVKGIVVKDKIINGRQPIETHYSTLKK